MNSNWEGDKDLDSYKDEDWKGRVFDGKYDNRYHGVSNSGGGGRGWGGSYGSYSGRRRRNRTIILATIIPILALLVFFVVSNDYLFEFDKLLSEDKPSSEIPASKGSSDLYTTLDSAGKPTLQDCTMISNSKYQVAVDCGNFGKGEFSSKIPVKTSIATNVQISRYDDKYTISFLSPSGQQVSYDLLKSSSRESLEFPSVEKTESPKITIPEIKMPTNIEIPQIKLPEVSVPTSVVQQTNEQESKIAIDYVNKLRAEQGRSPISWDSRVFQLALFWTKDMYDNSYLDHTNPFTGQCPYTLKSKFGINSNEFIADNAHATEIVGGGTVLYTPDTESVIDGWMNSPGHRHNLLYHDHVSGAYACTGGKCTFMGLNHNHFGEGCSTAVEGIAYFSKFKSCTETQLNQWDALGKQYDDLAQEYEKLGKEYDKIPRQTSSPSEYQMAMQMYNKLQSMYNQLEQLNYQIENFQC
ncbi:MAG: CAP domain-containing protein [Candidatus Nitrosotenuis sp.]